MRFVMINLLIVFLLLFGIGYLAFGHDGALTNQELLETDRVTTQLEHQRTVKNLLGESFCQTLTFLIK